MLTLANITLLLPAAGGLRDTRGRQGVVWCGVVVCGSGVVPFLVCGGSERCFNDRNEKILLVLIPSLPLLVL